MPDIDKEKTCCFFGHRKIDETEELKNNLCGIIENLIVNEKVDTFLFGSKSQFDDLCHEIVTVLKEKHPHIKRIYVRSAFQYIPDWYEKSLLENNEGTYFPEHIEKAGRASLMDSHTKPGRQLSVSAKVTPGRYEGETEPKEEEFLLFKKSPTS